MSELILYENARRALAEARRVDEVTLIRNKAVAVQVYARQAKDRTLIADATEIRMRAEFRAGEMLAEMNARGERQMPGGNRPKSERSVLPKLADLGVSRTQSSAWQRLAALPEQEREARIEHAKKRAEAAVTSTVKATSPAKKKAPQPINRCAIRVRAAVRATLRETPASMWASLFTALRQVLDDLEIAADRRRVQQSGTSRYGPPLYPRPARSTDVPPG